MKLATMKIRETTKLMSDPNTHITIPGGSRITEAQVVEGLRSMKAGTEDADLAEAIRMVGNLFFLVEEFGIVFPMRAEKQIQCYSCDVVRSEGHFMQCLVCRKKVCGIGDCDGRCGCYERRFSMNSTLTIEYYGLMDEMDSHPPKQRQIEIESRLDVIEATPSW